MENRDVYIEMYLIIDHGGYRCFYRDIFHNSLWRIDRDVYRETYLIIDYEDFIMRINLISFQTDFVNYLIQISNYFVR